MKIDRRELIAGAIGGAAASALRLRGDCPFEPAPASAPDPRPWFRVPTGARQLWRWMRISFDPNRRPLTEAVLIIDGEPLEASRARLHCLPGSIGLRLWERDGETWARWT